MAQVLSMAKKHYHQRRSEWRHAFLTWLGGILEELEGAESMDKLWDITGAILESRCEILGKMASGLIESRYRHLLDQTECPCPGCGKILKSRGKQRREIETRIGSIPLERPYFYCTACSQGFYPLDEALSLSETVKQYDVQDLEAWLGSELPFETASEAYTRCTGQSVSAQSVHAATNRIAKDLEILDVCPSREEIEAKIQEVRGGKFRRPVMMLAVDGRAHAHPCRALPAQGQARQGGVEGGQGVSPLSH